MALLTPPNVIAALLLLIPYLAVAFFPEPAARRMGALPMGARLALPLALAFPMCW